MPREPRHAGVPNRLDRERAAGGERGTGLPPGGACPPQDARGVASALWSDKVEAAEIVGLSRPTVQRYVAAFRDGGLDGLRRWGVRGPVSDLVAHANALREALTVRPVRTVAEAAEQIEQLTGLKRKPTQVRKFLKTELGFRWRRTRVIPCPPKKDLPDHIREQKQFL